MRNALPLLILLVLGLVLLSQCEPTPGPEQPVVPTDGPRVILCLRQIGKGTVDQIDQVWKIREAIEASTDPATPAFLWLPVGIKDERMNVHGGVAAYAALNKPLPYCWDIMSTSTGQKIIHEGPPVASEVLGWVGLTPLEPSMQSANIDPRWIDVDFSNAAPDQLGARAPPESLQTLYGASFRNIREMPGFEPIPKSEWPKWCDRFPIERLVGPVGSGPVYHVTEQVMGSCVGHACMNGMELPAAHMFGWRPDAETWLSALSIYHFIGRTPGGGSYIPDAAERVYSIGILPANNSPDAAKWSPFTHQDVGDFYKSPPAGYEPTAAVFGAGDAWYVDDEESAFALSMRDGLCWQIGRSSHSISSFGVAKKGNSYVWPYQNSWGTDWGDLGKSIGYDSRFYPGYVYIPRMRPGFFLTR